MAIIENRYKNNSQIILRLFLAIPEFLRRFSAVILFLISLQLLFTTQLHSKMNAFFLESSIHPIDYSLRFYKSITNEILDFTRSIREWRDVKEQNILLRLELERLKNIETDFSVLQNENESLKNSLKMTSEIKSENIPARVMSISTGVYGMNAILEAGSNSGVKENSVVIRDSIILGRIIEVSDNYSKMRLITDPFSRIPVVSSESKIHAILEGNGDENPSLIFIGEPQKMHLDEILLSSGDGMYFPQGFKIARITNIKGDAIYTSPIIDLTTLDFVNIIKN